MGLSLLYLPAVSCGQELASLSQYKTKAVLIQNPVDLTRLPVGEVYQINSAHFIIQFFFSGKVILGAVLKRDKKYPIHIRWCFFRSCEPSPYDYKAVLAQAYQKPLNEDAFQVRLPVKFDYKFQGLHFSSGPPPVFLE